MKDINLFRAKNSVYLKKVRTKADVSGDCDGYLIEADEKEARRIIASLKDKKENGKIGIVGDDDAFNRRAVESLKIDYLVSPERGDKRDSLKQRDSGINHVVAKLAREKGVAIVVDFNSVKRLEGKELALRLARIMQNVRICRKAGCGIRIGSFGSRKSEVFGERERRAFGLSLGMSSLQSRKSVRFRD